MKLVLKTNNPVQLNFAEVILKDAGIAAEVFDAQMSVMEGSVGVLPRRLMVADADFDEARRLLREGLPDAVIEGS
jgi:Putative prokaryotic signal transducing protein